MYSESTPSVAFSKASCHEHHSKSRHERLKRNSKVKNIWSYKTCMYLILLCGFLCVVIAKSDETLVNSDNTRNSGDRSSFTAKGM